MTVVPGQALRSRLGLRLSLILLAVAAIGLAVMGIYVTRVLESRWVEQLKTRLVEEAGIIHDAVVPSPGTPVSPAREQELAGKYAAKVRARVTIIAADGTVLGDSERDRQGVQAMENHAERPEVRAALAGETGSHLRRSRTLDVEMLYVAIPLKDGTGVKGALRLALPVTEVAQAVASVRRTVAVGGILALALAAAAGLFLSRRVTRRRRTPIRARPSP